MQSFDKFIGGQGQGQPLAISSGRASQVGSLTTHADRMLFNTTA
jgi:hypothetical protein